MIYDQISQTTRFYWKHICQLRWSFSAFVLSVIVAKTMGAIFPLYYKDFFNALSTGVSEYHIAFMTLMMIMVLDVIRWFFWRFAEYAVTYFQPRAMKSMYDEGYEYLQRHSYRFFTDNFAGSLVKKLNRLPRGFEQVTDRIGFDILPLFVKLIVAFIVMYTSYPLFSWIMVVWTILFMIGSLFFQKYRLPFHNEVQSSETAISGFAADTVSNNINVTIFATHKQELSRFHGLTHILQEKMTRNWNIQNIANAIQDFFMIIVYFILFYYGLDLWREGKITVGDFILLETLLLDIFMSIWDFGRFMNQIGQGFSDSHEMIEILNTPHEIGDLPEAKDLVVTQAKIEFRNLSFQYAQNTPYVLNQLNITLQSGEKVALVSSSGGGKSTITRLLLRLFETPPGTIWIDGQDIATVTQDSLRKSIALVPQDPILFHRSLHDNIAYGKPEASLEEIIVAAKKAHCHEFISQFPDGYNTFVGERGVKLSGGERQRVAIARAILMNAPILILDEATSSLDSEAESLIQDALHTLMQGKTSIVIAHRLSTILEMDRIIVLEQGAVTEEGTHQSLIHKEGSLYKKLWEIQAGGFAHAKKLP